jgi:two-component system phosphate regulon sensor histidine kinase PhoR
MRISFRYKLMFSYLLILLVMGGSVYFYLNRTLENSLVASLSDNLLSQTRLAALMLSRNPDSLQQDATPLAAKLGETLAARVTIIFADGRVVADSQVKPEELQSVENHLNRPEVRDALQSGTGSAVRYSSTVRHDMLYTAAAFSNRGTVAGVVRLSLPLETVQTIRSGLHKTLGSALLLSFLLTLVFSYMLSRRTFRPLQQVAAIAAEIGRGNFTRRLPEKWQDELGDLAGIMNDMAVKLDAQLSRLTTERNRLDAILAGMGESLMVTDKDGIITLVNPAFCNLFRVYDGLIGSPLSNISRHPALLDSYYLVKTDRCELQNEMTVHTPAEKFLLAHWVPLLNEHGLQGVVAVFHDVTDLKRLENIRRDFVANVSHELRTPVTVIKGYSETLLDGLISADPQKAAGFVQIILNHSERLATLLNDLLSLSEMESPDFSFQMNSMSVESTLNKVCTLLKSKADAKKVTFVTSGLERISPVLADQGRLEQVIVNLLDNAIKYSPEGGQIRINAEEDREFITVSVIDSGPGVPEASIPRLFERFYRVDSGRSRTEGGTGLGLAIVKHIVQLHGGNIWVKNNVGVAGAAFSFTLKKAL